MQTTHSRSNGTLKVTVLLVLVAALGWSLTCLSPAGRNLSSIPTPNALSANIYGLTLLLTLAIVLLAFARAHIGALAGAARPLLGPLVKLCKARFTHRQPFFGADRMHPRGINRHLLSTLAGMLVVAAMVPTLANAQICTLTSSGATYTIPAASHYDGTQTSNLTGVGTGDYLFEDGWWFRVSGDTQEFFFPAPTTTTCGGATGTITWTDVNGRGLFSATNTLTLSSAAAGMGQLTLTMSITNLTGSPLVITLFHGADFDVNGTAGTDSATLLNANDYIRITDATAGFAEYRAFNPSAIAFMVRPFAAATDVFGLLGDTSPTNFDNSGLPFTNADFTGAFQWNLNIPANGTASATVALSGNSALAKADLSITKTDGVTTATPGGSTTYTITASNAGPNNATGATVADTFPAALTCTWTCVGAGGGTCTAAGSGNINDTVNLPSGGSVTYTASCSISGGASGSLSNTATVTAPGDVADLTQDNNSATDTDTLMAMASMADLAITKTDGVTTATPGGSVTYTITASNAGPDNATGATVMDTFPAVLTCTWTCVGAGGGTCTAAGSGNINDTVNLPSGGSVTYTASCSISGGATGSLSNTATVAAPGGVNDPSPGNNSATDTDTLMAIIPMADLAITKTDGVTTATPGGSTTYTIVASNSGPGNASGATVADIFPAVLTCTWTCVGAGGGTCTAAGSGNINDTVNLPSGGSVTYTASCSISGAATGTLSNTATVTGPGGVTDPSPGNNSATDTDTIVCPTVTLAPATLPNGEVGNPYSQTVTANPAGGSYNYSVTNGALPAGLSLNASTGLISGTPSQTGTFNFRVTVTGFGSCTAFLNYQIIITTCAPITVSPTTLPDGTVGTGYSQTVSASPAGAYAFTVTNGVLPAGLSLNAATGVISGTPTTPGSFNFRVTAALEGCSGSRDYTVAIACPTLTLTPPTIVSGQAGVAYNQPISVSPAGSYTFSLALGNLPAGLTLNPATGVISGMPSSTGTTTFTVKAESAGGCSATQSYSLVIGCPTVAINPATLPSGTAGTAYSQTITASPAGGNYTFAVTSGSLPAGLNLNPATGVLSGTPTTNGSFTFTVTATGFGACTGSQSYTVVIGSGGCPAVTLPAALPNGSVGALYSIAVAASPSGLYSYGVTAGSLPPGVTLFGSNGVIFGYPTAVGTYSFTITATQGACSGSQAYTVVIGAGFASSLTVFSDFDGDGKSDLSVFRGSDGNWLVANSGDGKVNSTPWGASYEPYNDVPVSGDYDGDGLTDLAVFRRGGGHAGYWFINRSSDGQVSSHFWGLPTDIPVPGDYDGDGKTDVAVWRGSAGAWYIVRSSDGGVEGSLWGAASAGDIPVPGDYDGDRKTDFAVFRRTDGHWLIKRSSDGSTFNAVWGVETDVPVPGDYDADGKTDLAVWRASDGNWYIIESSSAALRTVNLGVKGDFPVAADYDGDGKADAAVWQKAAGRWLIKQSSDDSLTSTTHGQSGDVPIMARRN